MEVVLYGLPMCSRCKTAKQMLDRRKIKYRYVSLNPTNTPRYLASNLPILEVGGKKYKAKDALHKIRDLE